MKKLKTKLILILFALFTLVSTFSLANYSTVKMEVVEEPVCTIPFGPNSSFEKKLISKDEANKEVTIQLKAYNGEIPEKPTGELVLLLDTSYSTNDTTEGSEITVKEAIRKSAKTLISNLAKENDELSFSLVTFSSNEDPLNESTINDAFLEVPLTKNISEIESKLDSPTERGNKTNLDAGLKLAQKQFTTEKNNKYLIILSDGVPNLSVVTEEDKAKDSDIGKKYSHFQHFVNTKNELLNIQNNNINLITMLATKDSLDRFPSPQHNLDGKQLSTDDPERKSFGQIITEIFGTPENPTAGTFYHIGKDDIEKTITNNIYNDLVPISKSYKNLKIVDYFPKEIIDNFEFSYVTEANIGNISAEVDKETNSITWTIPELKPGETATVQYKLKLKEDFDEKIVDKILDTNEKVELEASDVEKKTSDVTPKLKLTEPPVAPEPKPELPKELPFAGSTKLMLIGIPLIAIAIFSVIKFNKYKDL